MYVTPNFSPVCQITKDTTRGSTTVKVLKGTWVNVLAVREDPDGRKLLVRIDKSGPFQVRADETDCEFTQPAVPNNQVCDLCGQGFRTDDETIVLCPTCVKDMRGEA